MSLSELPAEVVSESPANAPSYVERDPDAPVVVTGSKDLSVKLKACPLADGSIRVTLPCGTTRMIRRVDDEYHPEGCFEFGRPETFKDLRRALDRVARFSKLALAPLPYTAEQVRGLAKDAESSSAECCKILRILLRDRTGREWSVKRGQGTSSSWVRIGAPPRRCGEFREMNVDDRILLHAAVGDWEHTDISIRPCGGVRGYYVFKAAGLPVPDDWRINERSWD